MLKVKYVGLITVSGTRFKYTDCSFYLSSDNSPILYILKDDKNIAFPLNNILCFDYVLSDEEVD